MFDDDDWEHCLGGIHATTRETGEVVAHASVVQRRLYHGGRAWRAGYVEAVAVRADRRRHGYGRAVMVRIGEIIDDAYEIGGLAAGEPAAALYRSLGWQRWVGTIGVLGPEGYERTPDDDGSVFVLARAGELDLAGDIACDWRGGAVW